MELELDRGPERTRRPVDGEGNWIAQILEGRTFSTALDIGTKNGKLVVDLVAVADHVIATDLTDRDPQPGFKTRMGADLASTRKRIEADVNGVDQGHRGFSVAYVDGRQLPFMDASIDLVFMRNVLHLLEGGAESVFSEVSRVLQDNGVFVVNNTFRERASGLAAFRIANFDGLPKDAPTIRGLIAIAEQVGLKAFDHQVVEVPVGTSTYARYAATTMVQEVTFKGSDAAGSRKLEWAQRARKLDRKEQHPPSDYYDTLLFKKR